MREQEMRQLVTELMSRAVRKVVLPTSLGVSLALAGGCGNRAAPVASDGGAVQTDSRANSDLKPPADPRPDVAPLDDQGSSARYAAQFPDESIVDTGAQTKYAAHFPEPDEGAQFLYAAPFPDDEIG